MQINRESNATLLQRGEQVDPSSSLYWLLKCLSDARFLQINIVKNLSRILLPYARSKSVYFIIFGCNLSACVFFLFQKRRKMILFRLLQDLVKSSSQLRQGVITSTKRDKLFQRFNPATIIVVCVVRVLLSTTPVSAPWRFLPPRYDKETTDEFR